MGAGYSQLFPCFNPAVNRDDDPDVAFTATESFDETLGHSFCYVRSSARFVSPTHSDRFLSPTQSLRFDPDQVQKSRHSVLQEPSFLSISGASVCANTSTPRTVLQIDNINDNVTESSCTSSNSVIQYASGFSSGVKGSVVNGFEGTSSFSALPLQLVPRGGAGGGCSRQGSGQFERALFMSGPIQRGALSGPLDSGTGGLDGSNSVTFSAPLGGMYAKKKRRKGISVIKKAFSGKFMESKRPWVVPERNDASGGASNELESSAQWALGKAGEDRVHVVVSEEHGWLFVGIYDGFNGPDAPEFLMSNLYRTMYKELEGLFWDSEDSSSNNTLEVNVTTETLAEVEKSGHSDSNQLVEGKREIEDVNISSNVEESNKGSTKKVTFQSGEIDVRRRRLWEFLAEDNAEEGLDLSGSDRFAFSVDDAISVSNARSSMTKRSLLLSKLKHGFLCNHKENMSLFRKEKPEAEMQENCVEEEQRSTKSCKRRKVGPVDPEQVLSAMSKALDLTELAYLDMTDKVLDRYPELALMGSCLLVVLMRDEDVYVMNVGDSRAIVAQYEPKQATLTTERSEHDDSVSNTEGIVEESANAIDKEVNKLPGANEAMKLTALQLSSDHSTSIDEEVVRIKNEHPDDTNCIANGRVKGRLKVTRAFGAGFLKKPKLNDALLEMFRNEYIGTAPYISCSPSLCHHRLCPKDQFLVLSSDGLYQYFSNQEVVSFVENFMEKFPDGDPAQYLIEELLVRAANKAGMDFHELLDIPKGDRRKYHDDVTVMIISLEGRIWKSSGKYHP